MKVSLLYEKSDEYLSLKNLAIIEGLDFDERSRKAKSEPDLLIATKYIKTNSWLVCQVQKIDKQKPPLIVDIDKKTIEINIPIFTLFKEAFSFKRTKLDLNRLRLLFYEAINTAAKLQGKTLETKWYYPNTCSAAAAITHDIDYKYAFDNLFSRKPRFAALINKTPCKLWLALTLRNLNLKKRLALAPSMLDFDDLYNFKSTCFIRAEHQKEEAITGRGIYDPSMCSQIRNHNFGLHFGAIQGKFSGGNIDLHKFYSPVISPWTSGIKKDLNVLRKHTKITGTRSHGMRFWMPQTLNSLEKNVDYDSSLYAELTVHAEDNFNGKKIYTQMWKSPNGIAFPFYPIFNGKIYDFLEFPVTHYECQKKRFVKKGLDLAFDVHGVATSLYHPTTDPTGLINFLKLSNRPDVWKTTLEELAIWFKKRRELPLKDCLVIRVGGNIKDKSSLIKVGRFFLRDNRK